MKHIHIIGKRINKQYGRFKQVLDDAEFDAIIKEIGGHLPPGYVAWHISEREERKNSKRLQRLKKLPLVTKPNIFSPNGHHYANTCKELRKAAKESTLV